MKEVWQAAIAAGQAAGEAAAVRPMVVSWQDANGPQSEFVEDGVCGFAWVVFPGNDAFGRWAKQAGVARKHYPKGLSYWVSGFGQSMQRKEAFAKAMAGVLKNAGVDAWADSRMD